MKSKEELLVKAVDTLEMNSEELLVNAVMEFQFQG